MRRIRVRFLSTEFSYLRFIDRLTKNWKIWIVILKHKAVCHVYWTIYNHYTLTTVFHFHCFLDKQNFQKQITKRQKKFIQRLNLMKLGEIVEQSKLSWTTYFELESAHRRSSLSRSLWLNYISISINLTTKIFSLAYASSDLVVSIRKAEDTTNEEKDWKSKKLAIEELILQIIIFNKKLTEISTFHSSKSFSIHTGTRMM